MSIDTQDHPLRGKNKLRGLMPVIPTPVTEDEQIDAEGVERMSEFILRYPFCGIWALATAGEDQNLPEEKIVECTKLLVQHLGGKLPLLVKTSKPGTVATVERTKRFADLGIDSAIVLMEQKNLGVDHQRRFFETIIDASPIPVTLYNNPGRGADLDDQVMLDLTQNPKCVAMKAGGSNLSQLQKLALFAHEDFSVFTAGAGQLLAGLAMGVSGHTAIPLLALPELAFAVYDHFQAGRIDQARAEQKRIIEFIQRMPKLQNREVNGETKCVLEIRGTIDRYVSAPFISATDEQKAEFERLIDELDIFNPLR